MHVNKRTGFVLPVVLGIILLVALFAAQSATELGSTTLLASQRLLHQRAFETGESGVIAALEQLQAGIEPPASQRLESPDSPDDAAIIESIVTAATLPAGHSAGRIVEKHYEIRSSGHSARGAAVTIVQGVRQWQPEAAP